MLDIERFIGGATLAVAIFLAAVPSTLADEITVVAAGQSGEEIFELEIDGQIVGSFNANSGASSGQFESFTFTTVTSPRSIRILFNNDLFAPPIDRNLRVDAVIIDSIRYETEDESVFSVGSHRAADGCAGGYKQSEWLHCNGYFLFDLDVVSIGISGEIGTASVNNRWQRIDHSTSDPVVIAGPPSFNDSDPGVVQVKNITNSSFEIRFKEWNYLDGVHGFESIDWLVLEPGRFETGDGSSWEVGTFDISGNARPIRVNFQTPFTDPPYLFLTLQTQMGAPVTARAQNVTESGFTAEIYEEQIDRATGHGFEVVGYLAINAAAESGVVTLRDVTVPYLLDSRLIGGQKLPIAGVDIFVEEEQSGDQETNHGFEQIHALALGSRIFAQDTSTAGRDTAALRSVNPKLDISLQPGFELVELNGNSPVPNPISLEVSDTGRIFVAEEVGLIWEIVNGVKQPVPTLDLRARVADLTEVSGGLSGFALDPNFATNRYIYVSYTTYDASSSFGRLERYTLSPYTGRAVASTRKILIGVDANDGLATGTFHNLGDIKFGRDGSLLLSWGDTASNDADDPKHFRAQDLNIGAGKILRVNPRNGRGYQSNPFFNGIPTSIQARTWALGLRNGFRFNVQPETGSSDPADGDPGTLYIADVGRNNVEELNLSTNGGENFGWPYFEGSFRFRSGAPPINTTFPVLELVHPDWRGVIGGDFYRGNDWPARYQNAFLMADFVTGELDAYTIDQNGIVTVQDLGAGLKGITDMEYDQVSGQVYLIGRGRNLFFAPGEGLDGLYRLQFNN